MVRTVMALALLVGIACSGCINEPVVEPFTEVFDRCGVRPSAGYGGAADWSKETLEVTLRPTDTFRVQVPVLLSDAGSNYLDWAENIQFIHTAQDADTTYGPGFELAASEFAVMRSCSIQSAAGGNGCCAEQYLDGRWSLGPDEGRSGSVRIRVLEGPVDVSILYLAESQWCSRSVQAEARNLQPGWHTLEGEDEAWCT